MIDGIPLIDAHVHAAALPGLKLNWRRWTGGFPTAADVQALYQDDGTMSPARFDEFLAGQGVDLALLLAEYSPRVTGMQTVEEITPLIAHNPERMRLIANVNPHLHYPADAELERQLGLGAVALKIHPVHGAFPANHPELYKAYARCEERGVPIVIHFGTSVFPGAANRYVDEAHVNDVIDHFPDLKVVLAHGGRGWSYDVAAILTLGRPNVWIEISGLPPKRLPEYFARFDFERLAKRFIFGTDWPGVPGIRRNAEAVADLGLKGDLLEGVFWRNAASVYRLDDFTDRVERGQLGD